MKKVIMFSGSWCGPCKVAKPTFEKIKETTPNVQFEVVDVDENPVMATNFNVSGVPTFVVMENDVEINRIVGGANVTKLKEIL